MVLKLAGPFLNLTMETSRVEYLRGGSLQWVGPHRVGWGETPRLKEQGPGVWRAHLLGKGGVTGALGSRRARPHRRLAEELDEAGLAVGLARALLEGALGEWAQAEGAGEVVWVEAAAQGGHATAGHGEATRGAQRTTPRVEVVLAQRAALVLKKAASREGREAFLGAGGRERIGQPPTP